MSFISAIKLIFGAALAASALSTSLAHAQGTTKMTEQHKALTTDKSVPGYWRVTLNNPPINTITDRMYDEFYDLVGEIEADQSLKVVSFESANPDFFIAHYSTAEPRSRFGVPRWIEAADRLSKSSVLSIAVIRGRVRGGGSEFTMGCDIRFASREKAIFGQPEVATGLIPGGGALDRLPCWSAGREQLRSSLGRMITTPTPPNGMAGSIGQYPMLNSTRSWRITSAVSSRSTNKPWALRRQLSIELAWPIRYS